MHYVLSDIHGNRQRFDSILRQIALKPEDTLYILGDVIDRFPEGGRILRQIMKMPNGKMLLGNHEYMMLEALLPPPGTTTWEQQENLALWYQNGGKVTHDYLKRLRKETRKELLDFVAALPLDFQLEVNGVEYKLVHAAPQDWHGRYEEYFPDRREFAVWMRVFQRPPEEKAHVIFGHTPTGYLQRKIPPEIWQGEGMTGIDCGCGTRHGRLACLRLEDGQVFYSRDPEPEETKKGEKS